MTDQQDWRRRAQRARKAQRAWAAGAGGRSGLPAPMGGVRQRGGQPTPVDHDHPYVRGIWPRLGDRRLYVRELDPAADAVEPPEYGDLWADITGLGDGPGLVEGLTPRDNSVRMGSSVLLTDGRVLYVWADGNAIKQGHSPTPFDYFTAAGSVVFDRDLHTDLTFPGGATAHPACAVARDGTRLLLTTFWWSQDDNVARDRLYQSTDEGESWSLVTELASAPVGGLSRYNPGKATVGPARRLADGSLVMLTTRPDTSRLGFGETWPAWHLVRSTNGGASWSSRHVVSELAAVYQHMAVRTIGGSGATLFWSWWWDRGAFGVHTAVDVSFDYGQNWTRLNSITPGTGITDGGAGGVVLVAPEPAGPDGWAVVTVGGNGTLKRWLVEDLGSPVAAWTEVPTSFAFPGTADFLGLDVIDGTVVVHSRQYTAQTEFQAVPCASWWVRTDDGRWVEFCGSHGASHSHEEYAPFGHTHPDAEPVPTTLGDLVDVDIPDPADGAVIHYDTGTSSWAARLLNHSIPVGPTPPAIPPGLEHLPFLWLDTSGTTP